MAQAGESEFRFLADNTRAIARGMAVRWTWTTQTQLLNLLRAMGSRSAQTAKAFTGEQIKAAWGRLKQVGLLRDRPDRPGYVRLADPLRIALYREILDTLRYDLARDAMYKAENIQVGGFNHQWPTYDAGITVALLRLAVFSGAEQETLGRMQSLISYRMDWNTVLREACYEAFDARSFERIAPDWRWGMLFHAVQSVVDKWHVASLPMAQCAERQPPEALRGAPDSLRLQLAEWMLQRGDVVRMNQYLAANDGAFAAAMKAAALVQAGKHEAAQLAMEAARKFCLGESGSRTPGAYAGWGLWVHVLGARLGECALDRRCLEFQTHSSQRIDLETVCWKLLLRAWAGAEGAGPPKDAKALDGVVAELRSRLRKLGLDWLDAQVAAAHAVILGEAAPAGFVLGDGQEAWRGVLASLLDLGGETAADGKKAAAGDTRILWALRLGKDGLVASIYPMEQKQGPRGWSKPKAVSLSRPAGNEKLAPWDAKVAQSIRADRHYAKRHYLDRAAAIMALIGHPAVVLDDRPDVNVDLIEGMPQMEVLRKDDKFVMQITPAPHPELAPDDDDYDYLYDTDEAQRKEAEALRYITVLQDSPQRLRVIRFTAAQRRAAQLVSGRFAVPASAQDELHNALRALAGHFDVQSDHAAAAREEAALTQLRAELSPAGDGLLLRLVAAPLGADGPRLMPGQGRERVMAAIAGETVGTLRDLAAEQAHLDAVIERLPFLTAPRRGDSVCEWAVDDPELALAMVEALPPLAAIAAMDWPRGKAVRVTSVDASKLKLTVKTERDWFRLDGRAELDEGRVFELQALLAAAAGKSRFVALGEGEYLALSAALRERLAALSAVVEIDKGGIKAPNLASAWLDESLDGIARRERQGLPPAGRAPARGAGHPARRTRRLAGGTATVPGGRLPMGGASGRGRLRRLPGG